eukprot:c18209_g1_i2.p1 GENE.c18209_g1_i2~~c18209_g1_i2.p1  ORF type:complete len:1258 (+),score=310.27 c18209_g1_i2:57-3830(+)
MESIAANFLTQYAEKFLKDFKREDFALNVLRGEISLRNVELRESLIREILGLPNIIVTRAFVSSVYCKAPLTRLMTEPITVMLGTVEVRAQEPKHLFEVKEKGPTQIDDKKKEKDKPKGDRAVHEQLVDAIRLEIKEVHIYIDSLGPFKTDLLGPWTPSTIHIRLDNIISYATDSKWQLVHARELRRDQEAQQEITCHRETKIAGFSVVFEPRAWEQDPDKPEGQTGETPNSGDSTDTTNTPQDANNAPPAFQPSNDSPNKQPAAATPTRKSGAKDDGGKKGAKQKPKGVTILEPIPLRVRIVLRKMASYDVLSIQIELAMQLLRITLDMDEWVTCLRTVNALKLMLARPDLPEMKRKAHFPLVLSVVVDTFLVRLNDSNHDKRSVGNPKWLTFALRLQRVVMSILQPPGGGMALQLAVDQITAVAQDTNELGTDRILHGATSALRHSLTTRNIPTQRAEEKQFTLPPLSPSLVVRPPAIDSAAVFLMDVRPDHVFISVHVGPIFSTLSGALVRMIEIVSYGFDHITPPTTPPPNAVHVPKQRAEMIPATMTLAFPCMTFAMMWYDKRTASMQTVHLNGESMSITISNDGEGNSKLLGDVAGRVFTSEQGGQMFPVIDAANIRLEGNNVAGSGNVMEIDISAVPLVCTNEQFEQILQVGTYNLLRLQALIACLIAFSKAIYGSRTGSSTSIVRVVGINLDIRSKDTHSQLLTGGIGEVSICSMASGSAGTLLIAVESVELVAIVNQTSLPFIFGSHKGPSASPPCFTFAQTVLADASTNAAGGHLSDLVGSRETYCNNGNGHSLKRHAPPEMKELRMALPLLSRRVCRNVPPTFDGTQDLSFGTTRIHVTPALLNLLRTNLGAVFRKLPNASKKDIIVAAGSHYDVSYSGSDVSLSMCGETFQLITNVGLVHFHPAKGVAQFQMYVHIEPINPNSTALTADLTSPVHVVISQIPESKLLSVEVNKFTINHDSEVWRIVRDIAKSLQPPEDDDGQVPEPQAQCKACSHLRGKRPRASTEFNGLSLATMKVHEVRAIAQELAQQAALAVQHLGACETEGFQNSHGLIEYDGWLTKMGHRVRSWKRRWFVVRSGCVYYYRNEGSTIHEGIIPLGVETSVRCADNFGRENCFVIENPRREYVLVAGSTDEMESWINVLLQVIARQIESPSPFIQEPASDEEEGVPAEDASQDGGLVQRYTTRPLSHKEKAMEALEEIQAKLITLNMAIELASASLGQADEDSITNEGTTGMETLEAALQGI